MSQVARRKVPRKDGTGITCADLDMMAKNAKGRGHFFYEFTERQRREGGDEFIEKQRSSNIASINAQLP
jgi:hypothetical protein